MLVGAVAQKCRSNRFLLAPGPHNVYDHLDAASDFDFKNKPERRLG